MVSPVAQKQDAEKRFQDYTLFRYVNLLVTSVRSKNALLLAETSLNVDPGSTPIILLIDNLKKSKSK